MEKTGRHLFVYGTLMSTAASALGCTERDGLGRESRSLGPATMAGARLYDLERYPGLVESGDATDTVQGEAVELLTPQHTLAWLDDYEGIVDGDHPNEYARIERTIRLASGAELPAWVYVCLRDVSGRRPIAGGRW
jgi:gamma-glutamylcyclotransferase (GGCT)/AIG2-like uncharacterized protein YtfP